MLMTTANEVGAIMDLTSSEVDMLAKAVHGNVKDIHKEFKVSQLLGVEITFDRPLDIIVELVCSLTTKHRNRLIERYGRLCADWASKKVSPHLRTACKMFIGGGDVDVNALVQSLLDANESLGADTFPVNKAPTVIGYNTVMTDYLNILHFQTDEQEAYLQLTVDTVNSISKLKNEKLLTTVLDGKQ